MVKIGDLIKEKQKQLKITLDVIMLIVTVTLFDKSFISLHYHEVAGLVLIGIMALHNIVNIKAFVGMGKYFKQMPRRFQIGFITDIVLLVCFLWIGISGVLCSRTILTWISSDNAFFKLSHMFVSGVSVFFLGIHMGLHIKIKKMAKIPVIVCSALIVCIGFYGFFHTSELRWLSMPYSMLNKAEGVGTKAEQGHGNMPSKEGREWSGKDKGESREWKGNRGEKSGMPMEGGKERGHGQSMGGTKILLFTTSGLKNMLLFLFMILMAAVITYWLVEIHKHRKMKRLPLQAIEGPK